MTRGVSWHYDKPLIDNHLELTVHLVLIAPGTPTRAPGVGEPTGRDIRRGQVQRRFILRATLIHRFLHRVRQGAGSSSALRLPASAKATAAHHIPAGSKSKSRMTSPLPGSACSRNCADNI